MTFFTFSLNFGTLHLQTFAVCCTSFERLLFAAYNIQGVRKIATNISGRDLEPQKKEKKLYKHRSGNKSFPSYSHLYV